MNRERHAWKRSLALRPPCQQARSFAFRYDHLVLLRNLRGQSNLLIVCDVRLMREGTKGGFMDTPLDTAALTVFAMVVVGTFLAAWKGKIDSAENTEDHLAQQQLNRWLVALSAGATANSGFVVTGAVGLGYTYGVYWLLLPLGWCLGDLIFWSYFPHRINSFGNHANATTLTNLLTHGLPVGRFHPLVVSSTLLVVVCLGGYTMSQWVAGQKFLEGAFGISGRWTLLLFAALVTAYSSLGRFRGSVYADAFQAITRLLGTVTVFVAVCWYVAKDPTVFTANLISAGQGFLDPLGGGTIASAIGFVVGYAAAALGYGLGQPQVTSRYMAASSPEEVRAARWIYIGYVQFTWATMTLFGVLLRGVMPEIEDPEAGLTVFASAALPPVVVGFIVADMFGAIASTANSVLVAMAQALRDLPRNAPLQRVPFWGIASFLGAVTMLAAASLQGRATVFELAITSVSLMAAGIAPAVAIKVLQWRHSAFSLSVSLFVGVASASAWLLSGLSTRVNESAIGIALGLVVNLILSCGGRPTPSGQGDAAQGVQA